MLCRASRNHPPMNTQTPGDRLLTSFRLAKLHATKWLALACLVLVSPPRSVAQTEDEPLAKPIAAAVRAGDISGLHALVAQDGGARGPGGTTALLAAAMLGQLDVIEAMC